MLNITFKVSFPFALVCAAAYAHANRMSLPIIPDGAGYGITTPAGSGRHLAVPRTQVFKVNNLRASGAGSLQECIYANGPRTCVFEVSGTIDLTGDKSYDGSSVINLKNPFITIAGQTAPSPGITVKGKTLRIEAHDVLIQHLRFRVGDSPDALIAPEVRDTILIAGSHKDPSRTPHNIVIDHCSMSWAIDEVVSIKDTSHTITLSNNIISEGLDRSLHPKGRHSKGLMAVGNYLSIHRNLIASVVDRAPLDISPNSIYINNLSSNAKHATFGRLSRSRFYSSQNAVRNTVMVGNVRVIGATTPKRRDALWGDVNADLRSGTKMFLSDNGCDFGRKNVAECEVRNAPNVAMSRAPNGYQGVNVWPASDTREKVLRSVGARPRDRDAVDRRIVEEAKSGLGEVPDCVSGKPTYYPAGEVVSLGSGHVSVDLDQCYEGRFEGQTIELFRGESRKVFDIVEHRCIGKNQTKLFLAPELGLSSKSGQYRYRILNRCSKHAGGFPKLAVNNRPLDIPNDFNRLTNSGYTVLEEYLHQFYSDVE